MMRVPAADAPLDAWIVLPGSVPAEPFALFGMKAEFDIDDVLLRKTFLDASRRLHPDGLSSAPVEAQAIAMQVLARVNAAYETLRDPTRRAEAVLLAHGGASAAQDKRVPPEVLSQTLLLREELEEGGGAPAVTAEIQKQLTEQREQAGRRMADLARELASRPNDATRSELRLLLNSLKYLDNLLMHIRH